MGAAAVKSDSNPSGLTEVEVEDAIAFADAAQYLASGRADERSRELARDVARGNLTGDQTMAEYLTAFKAEEPLTCTETAVDVHRLPETTSAGEPQSLAGWPTGKT